MENFDWIRGFVYPYINFFLFLAALVLFARKPLVAMASKKKTDFEQAMAAAQKARLEAEKKNAELTQRLGGLEKELADLRAKILSDADAEAKALAQKATSTAEHLKSEAKRIAETELEEAKLAIRGTVVSELRKAIESEIKNTFSADKSKSFASKQVEKLSSIKMSEVL